jgi:DNA polymerase I-like protein with 3'-5' exonuclease and polymerase domains
MHVAYFDIETNMGTDWLFLNDFNKIHCVAVSLNGDVPVGYGERELDKALEVLSEADIVIGHNVMRFDIPVLSRFGFKPKAVLDTLICSRLIWPEIRNEDLLRHNFPKEMFGSHSLKAWGHRLGVMKGDFSEKNDFSKFTPEMLEYCRNDVTVTRHLHDAIVAEGFPQSSFDLEHDFARTIIEQEKNGFCFDVNGAKKLMGTLTSRKLDIEAELKQLFPARILQLKTKQKIIPFNPASRVHIADGLIEKYGWKPEKFTDGGRPQIDEVVLSQLDYPEAKLLSEYLLVDKRLGQIANGDNAWIKLECNGRIHGRVNTNGTVTGRCSHSNPNMAQCPRVGSPYGTECRSLFMASPNNVLVGVDASGLELRCLAHFMAQYDDGQYAKIVCEGDVHTENQRAAGLETRNQAKTFIYALIYGAGNAKLGSIVGGGQKRGSKLKNDFFNRFPAIRKLKDRIDLTLQRRTHLIGLDGRKLHIRSQHLALNTLLQSAGALLVKKATILANEEFTRRKLNVRQVAHVHDEIQYDCNKEIADEVGNIAVNAIKEAGRQFHFRCPLSGEFKVGRNWAETH